MTVNEVSQIFSDKFKIMDFDVTPKTLTAVKESELLRLDSTKAHSELNWISILTPTEAVETTIEWEKIVKAGTKPPSDITEEQICQYLEKAL